MVYLLCRWCFYNAGGVPADGLARVGWGAVVRHWERYNYGSEHMQVFHSDLLLSGGFNISGQAIVL